MAKVQDLSVNLDQLASDLAQAPPPSGDAIPPDLSSMPDKLQQLSAMLVEFSKLGAITQRADGSFIPAGYVDPRGERIAQQGSDCHCTQCTPYNQRHWYCAGPGCYSGPHEWVLSQPKAEPKYELGEAGRGGKAYQFCHPQCRVNFMNVQHAQQGQLGLVPTLNPLDTIPLAG